MFSFIAGVALCVSSPRVVAGASAQKPHVVMIIADDLGWNDLGFRKQNEKEVRTPVIDGLTKTGRVLENYYVQASCSPTRASFLTGRYPVHHGVANAIAPDAAYGLPLNETTLPQLLRAQGYRTHAIGKWHLGFISYAYTPTFRGFESFYGFYGGGEDYFDHTQHRALDFRRDRTEFCGKDCSHVSVEDIGGYSTHLFTNEAVRIIQDHDLSRPLFLWLSYQAVHWPDMVPEEYSAPYAGVFDDDKLFGERRQIFAGMLAALDEGVGKVVEAIKSKGMLDHTFLIFTTDNGGPSERDHQDETPTGSSNFPLRGGKGTIYEGGCRGTAIIQGPGVVDLGKPIKGFMHAVDWVPTLLSMIGEQVPPESTLPLDGEDVWPALSGRAPWESSRSMIYYGVAQTYMHGPAVRLGDLKLVLAYPVGGYQEVRDSRHGALPANKTSLLAMDMEEKAVMEQHRRAWMARDYQIAQAALYDVTKDINESKDIAQERPEDVQTLLALLSVVEARPACMDCGDSRCPDATEKQAQVQVPNGETWHVWEPYCDEFYPPSGPRVFGAPPAKPVIETPEAAAVPPEKPEPHRPTNLTSATSDDSTAPTDAVNASKATSQDRDSATHHHTIIDAVANAIKDSNAVNATNVTDAVAHHHSPSPHHPSPSPSHSSARHQSMLMLRSHLLAEDPPYW